MMLGSSGGQWSQSPYSTFTWLGMQHIDPIRFVDKAQVKAMQPPPQLNA